MFFSRQLQYGIYLYILYALWGFIFFFTIYASSIYVYLVLIGLLMTLGKLFLKKIGYIRDVSTIIWLPYLMYTLFYWLFSLKLEFVTYIISCISLISLANVVKIRDYFPVKILLCSGLFAILGIVVQIAFSDFYTTYVSPLFTNSETLSRWVDIEYGYSGFTYQLDTNANILLFAEATWLYYHDKVSNDVDDFSHMLLLMLFIIGIFLAGKRIHSAMSIVLPVVVYIISKPNVSKSLISFLFIGSGFALVCIYFVSYANEFTDSILLNRFANSVIEYQSGQDITSNRSVLGQEALSLSGSIFGIGIGEFKKISIYGTDAHQTYFQVLCEQGVLGFLLFIMPICFCVIKTIITLRSFSGNSNSLKFSLFIQLYFILYSFTGNTMCNTSNYFMYFFAIALLSDVCIRGESDCVK